MLRALKMARVNSRNFHTVLSLYVRDVKKCLKYVFALFFFCSPLRALLGGFTKSYKEAGRTKWMNSPNVYQKVEVLETGTDEPKKITKVEVAMIQNLPKKN